MSAEWLLRPTPRDAASLRLICFPYAGVSAAVYRLWPQSLPPDIDVVSVQLPGRGSRLKDAPIDRIDALVRELLPALRPVLDKPFAFFGHSMGAVLATEVTRALFERGGPTPLHLFVSARRPPHVPNPDPLLHQLPDDEFVVEINQRYGGIPAEVMQHADLMALLLPSLRADIAALETHVPAQRPPMDLAITAFGGAEDRLTPRHHLDAWQSETTGPFRVKVYPGDHFYLTPHRIRLLADVSAALQPYLAGSPATHPVHRTNVRNPA